MRLSGQGQASGTRAYSSSVTGVPYQAWERIGYLALARHHRRSALARCVFERIVQTRAEQDNEQWHLLILQDLVQRSGLKQPLLRHRLAPWLIAFFYYHVSWLLLVLRPEWSYRLQCATGRDQHLLLPIRALAPAPRRSAGGAAGQRCPR